MDLYVGPNGARRIELSIEVVDSGETVVWHAVAPEGDVYVETEADLGHREVIRKVLEALDGEDY